MTYSLGGTDAALFSLNEDYEYYLQSNAALDYDGKTSYSVTITVSDDNGGSDTITVTITDPVPEVEIWTSIPYDEPDWVLKLDTETGIVSASLCDDNFCVFATSHVKYNSISFTRPPGVQFDNDFHVAVVFSEEVSGFEQSELTLTDNTAGATISSWQSQGTHFGYVVDANIDVTTSGSVTFNVAAGVATDSGDQTTPAAESKTFTVTITLTEYPPWDVNEDGSVDATDSALVTAALGQTGEAIVNERTDVNWDGTVDTDDLTLVTYHIETDVDENRAPTFSGSSISYSITDIANASVGDDIGSPVTATDADNDTLSYSVDGEDKSYFSIVSSSGQLEVTQALIDDSSSSYSIKVIATDPSDATAEISVTITVTRLVTQQQQSNSAPVFDDGTSTSRSIAENIPSGQNIGDPVTATDDDNDTLTYSLEGTDADSFSIVSTSGQLQTSAALDYETDSFYTVTVKVTDDSGASNNSATITVWISVISCEKSSEVEDAITEAVGVDSYDDVTTEHLKSITSLDLSDQQRGYTFSLYAFWSDQFCDLPSLTHIDLSHNRIYRVRDNAFNKLPSLTHLDLSNTRESYGSYNTSLTLEEDAFAGLSSLTHLDLDVCIIYGLPSGVFDELSSLSYLDLNHNKIDNDGLPEDVFDGLSSLTELALSVNDITILPADIFDGLSSLTYLGLSHNEIDNAGLPSDVFDGLSSLEALHLYGNKLTSLPEDVFDGLSSLTELTLFNNLLTSLPEDVFDGLSSLEALRMGGLNHVIGLNKPSNSLTSLPSDIFDGLSSLTELQLQGNKLTSLPSDVFDGLSSLEELFLSGNKLTSLPSFNGLSSLSRLNISSNNLTSLSSGVFDGLSSLTSLGLSDNSLTSLPNGLFSGLTSLETLFLQGNDTDPINFTVTLVKEGDSSIKVSIPIGAPFDVIVPVTITNGSLSGGGTNITISTGSVESDAVAVTRTAGTTAAVTANIGTLPNIPSYGHNGYTLVKASTGLPLTVLDIGGAPSKEIPIPSATALLANYPNPFNPETWIPYHLANPSNVRITIYNMQGVVVRRLELGHQPAGYYTSRNRAAYWDGTNEIGERVACGTYFYQLQAGNRSYLRKMVILK